MFICALLNMPVARWEPTPCYRDAYSVGTPNRAFWVKGWLKHGKTMVFTLSWTFLLGKQKNHLLFFGFFHGFFKKVGPGILGLALGFSLLVNCLLSLLMLVAR